MRLEVRSDIPNADDLRVSGPSQSVVFLKDSGLDLMVTATVKDQRIELCVWTDSGTLQYHTLARSRASASNLPSLDGDVLLSRQLLKETCDKFKFGLTLNKNRDPPHVNAPTRPAC